MKLSLLDLAVVHDGGTIAQALQRTVATAQTAEAAGLHRVWLAEHHSMPGVASAATSIVIGHVAAATSTIRVGAGGIMLPNHAPLVVAEQFGTLCALYPDRIDLGLGRAPGTDGATAQALRHRPASAETYPQQVVELLGYFQPARADQAVIAVPGAGAELPVWVLGSSSFSAQLAAALGLPYAFAAHFAPAALTQSLALYHQNFRPSARLQRPHTMVACNVIAAQTEAEARFLGTTQQQMFIDLRRGKRPMAKPPTHDLGLSRPEMQMLQGVLSCSFLGTPSQVRDGLAAFQQRTQADELMITCGVYDHELRQRSLRWTAEAAL
ncbi:MAG: luciferase family oxidoreductase group 1 [Kiritimatiellia bacterium]|jgi:luciferase family oxidoreductase group 1